MLKAFVPALALVAAAPTAWAAGSTAVAGDATSGADLNGDGRVDRVAVRAVEDAPHTQELVAVVRGVRFTALVPMALEPGQLRVVDVDDDGRDEVVVTEVYGAHTSRFTVWGLHGTGLRAVTTPDGRPLVLTEGGRADVINRYGCEDADGVRRLVTVRGSMVLPSNPLTYEGERVTYEVRDGVAAAASSTPVLGGWDDAVYRVAPETCA